MPLDNVHLNVGSKSNKVSKRILIYWDQSKNLFRIKTMMIQLKSFRKTTLHLRNRLLMKDWTSLTTWTMKWEANYVLNVWDLSVFHTSSISWWWVLSRKYTMTVSMNSNLNSSSNLNKNKFFLWKRKWEK